jgi:hypothetical protein
MLATTFRIAPNVSYVDVLFFLEVGILQFTAQASEESADFRKLA